MHMKCKYIPFYTLKTSLFENQPSNQLVQKAEKKAKEQLNANQTQTNHPIWLFNIKCCLKKQVALWVTETQSFYSKNMMRTINWGIRAAPYFVLNILSRQATNVFSRPGTFPFVCKTLHVENMKSTVHLKK